MLMYAIYTSMDNKLKAKVSKKEINGKTLSV